MPDGAYPHGRRQIPRKSPHPNWKIPHDDNWGGNGRRDPHAAFSLRSILTQSQKQAAPRFGKYRFKLKPGQPQPDELKITLTGSAMPETLRRAALWSAQRHGLTD